MIEIWYILPEIRNERMQIIREGIRQKANYQGNLISNIHRDFELWKNTVIPKHSHKFDCEIHFIQESGITILKLK